MIYFCCPQCDAPLTANLADAGKRVRCARCWRTCAAPLDGESPVNASEAPAGRQPGEALDPIIEHLAGYLRKASNKAIDDFDRRASVTTSERFTVYAITLDTLYEERTVVRREEPYRGQQVPPRTVNEATVAPWSHRFPVPEEFADHTSQHTVAGSQEVRPCATCRQVGVVTCPTCAGAKETVCGQCTNGEARCSNCCGWGTEQRSYPFQRTENCICTGGRFAGSICYRCNGTGKVEKEEQRIETVPCHRCAGRGVESCRACAGRGIVNCPTCHRRGEVKCPQCQGQRDIVTFLVIQRSLRPKRDEQRCHTAGCSPQALAMLGSADFRPLVEQAAACLVPGAAGIDEPELLRDGTAAVLAGAADRVRGNFRVVRQALVVREADIDSVQYAYGGRTYECWLVGADWRVLAPTSPATDHVRECLERCLKHWEEGQRWSAAGLLKEVWRCAARDRFCRAILERYRDRLPWKLRFLAWLRHALGFESWLSLLAWVVGISLVLTLAAFLLVRSWQPPPPENQRVPTGPARPGQQPAPAEPPDTPTPQPSAFEEFVRRDAERRVATGDPARHRAARAFEELHGGSLTAPDLNRLRAILDDTRPAWQADRAAWEGARDHPVADVAQCLAKGERLRDYQARPNGLHGDEARQLLVPFETLQKFHDADRALKDKAQAAQRHAAARAFLAAERGRQPPAVVAWLETTLRETQGVFQQQADEWQAARDLPTERLAEYPAKVAALQKYLGNANALHAEEATRLLADVRRAEQEAVARLPAEEKERLATADLLARAEKEETEAAWDAVRDRPVGDACIYTARIEALRQYARNTASKLGVRAIKLAAELAGQEQQDRRAYQELLLLHAAATTPEALGRLEEQARHYLKDTAHARAKGDAVAAWLAEAAKFKAARQVDLKVETVTIPADWLDAVEALPQPQVSVELGGKKGTTAAKGAEQKGAEFVAEVNETLRDFPVPPGKPLELAVTLTNLGPKQQRLESRRATVAAAEVLDKGGGWLHFRRNGATARVYLKVEERPPPKLPAW